LPQLPQLDGLLLRFVSQPSLPPLQFSNGAMQLETPHTPSAQAGVPPLFGHTVPHFPQLKTLKLRSASQPSATPFAQLSWPTSHRTVHAPALQELPSVVVASEELERVTGLDRFALARHFRAATGTSPHRYQIGRRLARAQKMIADGMALSEAAAATGFADQSHLTRHFAARFGLTPGRFAKLAR